MTKNSVVIGLIIILAGFLPPCQAQTVFEPVSFSSPHFLQQKPTGYLNFNTGLENRDSWWSRRYLIDYMLIAGGTAGYIIGKGLTPRSSSLFGPSFDRNNPEEIFNSDRFGEPYLEHGVGETVPEYWMHRLLIGFGGALIAMEALEWSGNRGSAHRFHDTIVGYAETVALTAAVTELTKPFFGRLRPDFTERALRFYCPDSPPGAIEPFCDGYRDQPLDEDPDEALSLYHDGRKSFISGHSSHSFNLFWYASFAVGGRYVWGDTATSKSRRAGIAGQVVMMSSALYITSSRISDGRHHYSDVIAGSLTGLGIAAFSYWTRFDRDGNLRRAQTGNSEGTNLSVQPWVNPNFNGAGVRAGLSF
jgi:membrane-associated phospholipid phosphatase